MNYFAFIDETGTNLNDRFFGIGILTIPQVDKLYDKLKPISDQIREISKVNKQRRIDNLISEKKYDELAKLTKGGKTFELKYDRISNANKNQFINLIKAYFTVIEARFTALIIDKQNPTYRPKTLFPGTWDAYITYSCLLLERENRNLKPSTMVTIVDEITKQSGISYSLEEGIKNKFKLSCDKKGVEPGNLICSRAESNSHILIQMVDVLLGCVSFDYKRKYGLLSQELLDRRSIVVDEIKKQLNLSSLIGDFTHNKPNYFSVWEMNWK